MLEQNSGGPALPQGYSKADVPKGTVKIGDKTYTILHWPDSACFFCFDCGKELKFNSYREDICGTMGLESAAKALGFKHVTVESFTGKGWLCRQDRARRKMKEQSRKAAKESKTAN